jgi:hypothetical protein
MFKKALLIALAVPLLAITTAAASETPTPAVPQTMQLSSWQFEGGNGAITGGTRTVTILNTSATAATGVAFHLESPPCDCTLASASPSDGGLAGKVWVIDGLAVGTTATLDLAYVANK